MKRWLALVLVVLCAGACSKPPPEQQVVVDLLELRKNGVSPVSVQAPPFLDYKVSATQRERMNRVLVALAPDSVYSAPPDRFWTADWILWNPLLEYSVQSVAPQPGGGAVVVVKEKVVDVERLRQVAGWEGVNDVMNASRAADHAGGAAQSGRATVDAFVQHWPGVRAAIEATAYEDTFTYHVGRSPSGALVLDLARTTSARKDAENARYQAALESRLAEVQLTSGGAKVYDPSERKVFVKVLVANRSAEPITRAAYPLMLQVELLGADAQVVSRTPTWFQNGIEAGAQLEGLTVHEDVDLPAWSGRFRARLGALDTWTPWTTFER
jgi:hypothetical protein